MIKKDVIRFKLYLLNYFSVLFSQKMYIIRWIKIDDFKYIKISAIHRRIY